MPKKTPDLPDFSVLTASDVANLALQRTSRVGSIFPPIKAHPEDWRDLYLDIAAQNRERALEIIWNEICEVYDRIKPSIKALAPRRVADIGCGQAFIDLLIHRDTGADLLLIDIEETEKVHFGYRDEGAGYASLAQARAFLEKNGVPGNAIQTINPNLSDVADAGNVDLAISTISCGFHYPASTYQAFFEKQVEKAILLDVRKGRGNEEFLERYGTLTALGEGKRHTSVLVEKIAS
ncbi:MAG: hypothetical protein AAF376_14840 [Pseudomonadota bacterium]